MKRPLFTLARKELTMLLDSPTTYVVFVLFLALMGWFFVSPLFVSGQSTLDSFLRPLPILFTFLIPALSMRAFAEELKGGTIEYLSTLPLRDTDIVLGKYLALVALLVSLLALTLVYPLVLLLVGRPDIGQMVGSYAAVLCLGSFFAAIGLWATSLTRQQVVAVIISFFICFCLYLTERMSEFFPGFLADVLRWAGVMSHFEAMARGVVDTRDLLYWVSGTVLFLAATVSTIHSRRWR